MSIHVEHICKRYGSYLAIDDVSFDVETGQLVALLGPSGGGKSTLLRIISGLDPADSGSVRFEGEAVDHLDARSRRVGFVFQHYALFRHMNVFENVEFGLRVKGVRKEIRRARSEELLNLVGLEGTGSRYPDQLSGGQRQRVALARALAPEPRLLLLDEPFAAIDAKVREELRRWLRQLHDKVHVTSIIVTHDQHEAFSIADRIVVIQKGRLEQVGSPLEILERPRTEFVARFLGDVNVFEAKVKNGVAVVGPLRVPIANSVDDETVRLVVRSYDLKLWREDPGVAVVRRVVPLGDRVRVEAELDGITSMHAQFPRRSSLLKGVIPGCRVAVEVTSAQAFTSGGITAWAGTAPYVKTEGT